MSPALARETTIPLPAEWTRVLNRYCTFRSWESWRGRTEKDGQPLPGRWPEDKIKKRHSALSRFILRGITSGELPEDPRLLADEQAVLDRFLEAQGLDAESTAAWAESGPNVQDLWKLVIFDRDDYRCAHCRRSAELVHQAEDRTLRLELDHKHPQSKGGLGWRLDNIETTCRSCNVAKGQMDAALFRKELRSWAAAAAQLSDAPLASPALTAFDALAAAGEALARDAAWKDLLAENMYWASMEGFLQSSILGRLNIDSPAFVSDRERSLAPRSGFKPDLLVLDRTPEAHGSWWAARDTGGEQARETFRTNARLLVQLKVAWTEGNAQLSAVLQSKVVSIQRDVALLRQYAPGVPSAVCVLVSGFHDKKDGAREVETALALVNATVAQDVRESREIAIFTGYRPARWNALMADTPDRAAFSTLWLASLKD